MATKKRKAKRRTHVRRTNSRSGDIINIKVMDYDLPIVPLLIVGGLIAILATRKQDEVMDERQMITNKI